MMSLVSIQTRSTTALSLVLLALASPATAQRPQDRVSESITVLEVEVPVEALVDGRPLRGLGIDDFVVLDRGRPREIISFEVIDVGADDDSVETAAAASRPPHERRAFLVLFDFQYTPSGLLARAIRSLRSMVDDRLQPSDRMAIVALGGSLGAQVLVGFTSEAGQLHLGLDLADAIADRKAKRQRMITAELRARAPSSREELAATFGAAAALAYGDNLATVTATFRPELDISAALTAGSQLGTVNPRVGGSGIEEAFEIGSTLANINRFRQTKRYAEALGNLGTLLRSVDGQKHALLISQGPPLDTLITSAGDNKEFGAQGVAKAMERAFEQLNRAGWRVHTFGQGLSFKGSLFYLANGTGGRAYESFNRLETATAALIEQTSVTYLLRFLAGDIAMDGRRHRLEVELVDPPKGLELHHRSHYYAPRPASTLTDVERRIAAAERELEIERLTSMQLRTAAFAVPEADAHRVMVVVSMDGDELQRIATEQSVALELWIAPPQTPERDRVLERIEVDLGELAAKPRRLLFLSDVVVSPEIARLDVGARSGRRRWRGEVELDLQRSPALLPPLFVPPSSSDSQATRLILRESGNEPQQQPVRMPFTVAGQELIPALEPSLTRGQALGVALAAFDLPAERGGVVSRVLDQRGRERPEAAMSLRGSERQGRALLLPAVIETGGLEPGLYTLEVAWSGFEQRPVSALFRIVE